jgi:hypothetical protein
MMSAKRAFITIGRVVEQTDRLKPFDLGVDRLTTRAASVSRIVSVPDRCKNPRASRVNGTSERARVTRPTFISGFTFNHTSKCRVLAFIVDRVSECKTRGRKKASA